MPLLFAQTAHQPATAPLQQNIPQYRYSPVGHRGVRFFAGQGTVNEGVSVYVEFAATQLRRKRSAAAAPAEKIRCGYWKNWLWMTLTALSESSLSIRTDTLISLVEIMWMLICA